MYDNFHTEHYLSELALKLFQTDFNDSSTRRTTDLSDFNRRVERGKMGGQHKHIDCGIVESNTFCLIIMPILKHITKAVILR